MMKSKKGAIFLSVVIALVIWIFGILFIPFLMDDITTFRGEMDCTNTSITDGTKFACLQGDLIIPYAIWFFASLALGFIIGGDM